MLRKRDTNWSIDTLAEDQRFEPPAIAASGCLVAEGIKLAQKYKIKSELYDLCLQLGNRFARSRLHNPHCNIFQDSMNKKRKNEI